MASKPERNGDRKSADRGPCQGSSPGPSSHIKLYSQPETSGHRDLFNSDQMKQCLQHDLCEQRHSSKDGSGPAGGSGRTERDKLEAESQKQLNEFQFGSSSSGGCRSPSYRTGAMSNCKDEDKMEVESHEQAEESGAGRPRGTESPQQMSSSEPGQCGAHGHDQKSGNRLRRESQTESSERMSSSEAGHHHSEPENIKPKISPESHRPPPKERSSASCCQLDELKQLPHCRTKSRPLDFNAGHTVLVDVNAFNHAREIRPQSGTDIWGRNFVKMPCSPQSFMKETGFAMQTKSVKRWDVISKALGGLAKKSTLKVKALEEAIMKYNPKYKGDWSFSALSSFVESTPPAENVYLRLFPKIAELALKLPDYVKKAIPLLRAGRPATITMSQLQIACLLANAFLCTFPHRNTTESNAEYQRYPSINFSTLFKNPSPRVREKLRAIMHYFRAVTDESTAPHGLVTFERRLLADAHVPDWRRCQETMSKLYVTSRGTIEAEGEGMLQVDFASSWIGGGVLTAGLVQEEILFLINPELIVSRLFTEKLTDKECLIITGTQQFSRYSGFGDRFEWAGNHDDRTHRDLWGRKQRQILAIDALPFRQKRSQYDMKLVTRELNKAYCGFRGSDDEPDIATGKWGCGAFNGDPELKAVIQLMAAAKAKRGLAFFTFHDEKLKEDLQKLYELLLREKTTVETLFRQLEDYCAIMETSVDTHVGLFSFLHDNIPSVRSNL